MCMPRCETCKYSKWWSADIAIPVDLYCFHPDSEVTGEAVSPLSLCCDLYEEQGVGI